MYVATASFQTEQIESKELKTKGKKKIKKMGQNDKVRENLGIHKIRSETKSSLKKEWRRGEDICNMITGRKIHRKVITKMIQ